MKKFITVVIVAILTTTAMIPIFYPIRNVKAQLPESPLDEEFIELVGHTLANVAEPNERWMGREYGSTGERYAKDRLIELWHSYIDATCTTYNITSEKIDFGTTNDFVDNQLQIMDKSDFQLIIDGNTIDQQDYQPVPCLDLQDIDDDYIVRIPPNWWYTNVLQFADLLKTLLKENHMLYEFNYYLSNSYSGITGEVIYVDDYGTASLNDTRGKIHLIEIEQNSNDDVFDDIVSAVNETEGKGFILMTTNPYFIENAKISIPGFVISRSDGEKLKNIIQNHSETFVRIEGDPIPEEGTLQIYCFNENPLLQTNDVYVIDGVKCKQHRWDLRAAMSVISWQMFVLSHLFDGAHVADAFFYGDVNDDTHFHTFGSSLTTGDFRQLEPNADNQLKPWNPKPLFLISNNLKETLEGLEQEEVHLKISSQETFETEAYNVIGTIPGSSSDVIIVCGHYDSYWGQCAMDNAMGPAIAWGIAKYFKDNDYTPEYTLKLIAWSGEENIDRGAYFYVMKHGLENIKAVIDIDPVGMSDHRIPFTPWIYPGKDDNPQRYFEILEVMDPQNYRDTTGIHSISLMIIILRNIEETNLVREATLALFVLMKIPKRIHPSLKR